MKAQAIIAVTTKDAPKIKPTSTGAEVCFELYNVSIDELMKLTEKELTIEIKVNDN